jgi:CubicO group peptidase (beta-lactamase class C family)
MRQLSLWLALMVILGVRGADAQTAWPNPDWETATPASQGVDADGLEKARVWLESHNSKSGLVIRHGRIVAEWYFADAIKSSKFACYSTSKSLSSMATGLAITDGQLTLDDTVGKFVPDASPDGKRAITVKQLLSMTSGVHNDPMVGQKDDLFTYATKVVAMDHAPGEKWDYNNTGLALLSPIFQKAVGKSIDASLNEKVFQPIGIPADDWTWEQREGFAIPYSGCHMTARSMGRIGLMVLNDGRWKDTQIVPAS